MLAGLLLQLPAVVHAGHHPHGPPPPVYHSSSDGAVLFWFLFVAVGLIFLAIACSGVYYWHGRSVRHVDGYTTVIDEQGKERRLPYHRVIVTEDDLYDPSSAAHAHSHTIAKGDVTSAKALAAQIDLY